nr:hypothetical protein [Polycyclovorans algicola]
MKMTRYFFISDDLDDLEHLEEELERAGIVTPQIHLLTNDDGAAEQHNHLHKVASFMKRDIVHSTLIGAVAGICAATLVLVTAFTAGWTATEAGWMPFIFLSVVLLGFLTWQGGLWGIQRPNVHFLHFEKALKEGNHVFFVDLEPGQDKMVKRLVKRHPRLKEAGTAAGAPHWLIFWQHRVTRFFVKTWP